MAIRSVPYSIHHRTAYHYEDRVSYSHHLARLRPVDGGRQRHLSSRLVICPEPEILTTHRDVFGNVTTFFSVTTPHRQLTVESYARVEVETGDEEEDGFGSSPRWEDVRGRMQSPCGREEVAAAEFVYSSPLCPVGKELAAYARESFVAGAEILEGALELTRRIHRDIRFDPAATTVSTPVEEVFERRAGVCQDIAHLQIACLRSLGLPARYVSGYLRTVPPPGQERLVGADASHAWVSLFVPGRGWVEYDATNDQQPGGDHIRVAYGRDYQDICPLRGTVYGGGGQILEIGVTVTPLL